MIMADPDKENTDTGQDVESVAETENKMVDSPAPAPVKDGKEGKEETTDTEAEAPTDKTQDEQPKSTEKSEDTGGEMKRKADSEDNEGPTQGEEEEQPQSKRAKLDTEDSKSTEPEKSTEDKLEDSKSDCIPSEPSEDNPSTDSKEVTDSGADTTNKHDKDDHVDDKPVKKDNDEPIKKVEDKVDDLTSKEEDQPLANGSGVMESSDKDKDKDVEESGVDMSAKDTTVKDDKKGTVDHDSPGKGDSDKENVVGECPMDLSGGKATTETTAVAMVTTTATKGPPRTATPASSANSDVIMLSDDDDFPALNGMVNGFSEEELTPEKLKERKRFINDLASELRNEEAKLVLLRKIRQSQLMQHMQDGSHAKPGQSHGGQHGGGQHHSQGQGQPPPLVRGGAGGQQSMQQAGHLKQMTNMPHQLNRVSHQQQQQQQQQQARARLHNQGGPPPLVMAPRGGSGSMQRIGGGHSQQQQMMNNQKGAAPPNMVARFRGAPQAPQRPQPPPQPEQTPAQRQAAAKLALRKQLEKTLLQIPPPKPPAPEMNFIPSLSGNEFIMLVGLEEVVKYIVESDKAKGEKVQEVKYVFNPFVCVQCGTDFTPVWKRDKPGSKNVICEQCVTSNQKKALKQEHTNRLKSAFVKALQQEQEIEQRMQAQPTTTAASSSSTSSSSTPSHSAHHTPRTTSSTSGSGGSSAPTPMNLTTSSYKPTSEQIRQHQNLIQAHQAQLRASVPQTALGLQQAFNPRLAFPFQPPLTSKAASDLQRQYLLDMIPRSMPGGTVLWRT